MRHNNIDEGKEMSKVSDTTILFMVFAYSIIDTPVETSK